MPALSEIKRILDTGRRIRSEKMLTRSARRALARTNLLRTAGVEGISHEETFDLIFLGILAGTDRCSAWLKSYVQASAIDVDRIVRDAGLAPARFSAAVRARPQALTDAQIYETDLFQSTYVFGFLTYASDLARRVSGADADTPIDARHLLAIYIYLIEKYQSLFEPLPTYEMSFDISNRKPPEFINFADRIRNWGVDREDLSSAFLTFIDSIYPDEASGWKSAHLSSFGREPQLPHPCGVPLDSSQRFETMLDLYTVEGQLGEGGAGTVYRVKSEAGNFFALKRLNSGLSNSKKLLRFKQEVAYCLRARDERIVRILDYGFRIVDGQTEPKEPFYVMPLFDGTLRKLMRKSLTPHEAQRLFLKLLDAVECAHNDSVWHRDLKPENVLYDSKRDMLVLADFGIAHFEEDALRAAAQTNDSEVLANFKYAAPEQRLAGRSVDQRADIYALGLILNEMFTGQVPQGTGYRQIGDIVPDCSYLDAVVALMIRQYAEERPPTIAAVRAQIDRSP